MLCAHVLSNADARALAACLPPRPPRLRADETTWQELKDHFKAAGRVAHADILTVRGHGANRVHGARI